MRRVPPALALRLEPAASTFAERGFDATRIEDLTEATGIASSTLYYYFEGKREILVYLLEDFLERVTDRVHAAVHQPGSARDRLEAVIRTHLQLMEAHPHRCRVFLAELGRMGRVPDTAKAVNEAFHDPVQQLLREGAADGSLRALPPETVTAAIFGALTVTALHYAIAERPLDADKTSEDLLQLLATGYAQPRDNS